MYKIGIDARLYSQTGVGVYLRNLLYYLEKMVDKDSLFYIYLLPEDYDKVKFKHNNFIKRVVNARWHTIFEQIVFARILYQDNLDLVHFTYFSYPVLYRKKFISTIHDVTPLFFKTGKASTRNVLLYEAKFQAFKFVISQQVKNASIIIVPSITVKKQLIELYGGKNEYKIKPIYEGVDYQLKKLANKFEIFNSQFSMNFQNLKFKNYLTKPFFIYIGNFYPHKNVEKLIKAFAKVQTKAKLFLIGPSDYFSKRLTQLIKQLNQIERIVFYHNPTKKDLIFFYKHALALIHPSLSEGFGLPLIEAAFFNLPILGSKINVFKEVLQDKYISFNPNDTNDIAKKIKVFLSKKRRFNYSEINKKFSFERMAMETLVLYKQVLNYTKGSSTEKVVPLPTSELTFIDP